MTDYPNKNQGSLMPYEDALEFLLSRARLPDNIDEVDTFESLGRVLARGMVSEINVPAWDNSAMDGYAVRRSDIPRGGEANLPISQRIPAGTIGKPLQPGTAARIFTGAPVPEGADAVVKQELCRETEGEVRISGPVTVAENIRPQGNDIAAGSEILERGVRIRPQEMGLAASVGFARLPVYRRLKVATFTTGDELVMPGQPLMEGKIYNSNRFILRGLLSLLGCEIVDLGIVEDTLEATREILPVAADRADLIITSGGVSVGEEDYVKKAVESVGKLDLWRIRIKPGKPLAYGVVGDSDFIGVPGNPVSALVTFILFVRPFILRRQGVSAVSHRRITIKAGFSWERPGKRREFVRAKLTVDDRGDTRAELFPRQGSDVLTSMVWADGLVEIPEGTTIAAGDPVAYTPFADLLY
ncbi:MAG: molybdopterin molybdotransferase MoeA [Gammaproteobacteria bacterium]|nr:molybdopterin molybdotransferase MoeA [Gammaproteobacteria bacterium]